MVTTRLLPVLLVLALPSPAAAQERWEPDVQAARAFAQSRAGEVSFSVRDRGRAWGYRPWRQVHAASTVKTMLALAYLRRASTRRRMLTRSDRELLTPMIRRSGNIAATRVRNIVGNEAFARVGRAAGMQDFAVHPNWGASRISARDLSRLFMKLDTLAPDRHETYLRSLHRTIVERQRWGVGRAAPDGWRLYFKGGWGSGTGRVDHQGALLVRGDRRVALGITTTTSPSHAYGKATLEGVARRLLRGLR